MGYFPTMPRKKKKPKPNNNKNIVNSPITAGNLLAVAEHKGGGEACGVSHGFKEALRLFVAKPGGGSFNMWDISAIRVA